jgi:hypothetical protein
MIADVAHPVRKRRDSPAQTNLTQYASTTAVQ